jgi:hypothetical protein
MEHYAGIDVSLDTVSVCIVNGTGKVLLEAKMVCDPEALVTWFQKLDFVPKRSLAIQAPANPGDQRRQPDPKISRRGHPRVRASRIASCSNSFVNCRCCFIEFLTPHRELFTFPGQVQMPSGGRPPSEP